MNFKYPHSTVKHSTPSHMRSIANSVLFAGITFVLAVLFFVCLRMSLSFGADRIDQYGFMVAAIVFFCLAVVSAGRSLDEALSVVED